MIQSNVCSIIETRIVSTVILDGWGAASQAAVIEIPGGRPARQTGEVGLAPLR
jgi:hypothetical protein